LDNDEGDGEDVSPPRAVAVDDLCNYTDDGEEVEANGIDPVSYNEFNVLCSDS
jgi:hypothetical protein